ncbi:MAG: MBL fold metallo-hydrolase [Candidatus Helarchaeota archaeon]
MDDFIFIQANNPMWPASANIFAIKDDDGWILIDVGCGLRKFTKLFFKKLEQLNLNIKNVHTILITHAHPDHMGAMKAVLKKINPKIIINEIEKDSALNIDLLNKSFSIDVMEAYFKSNLFESPVIMPDGPFDINKFFQFICSMSQLPADIEIQTIKDDEIICLGEYKFRVLTTPGHAPGHTSLHEVNHQFLLSGDIIGEKGVTWYSPGSGGSKSLLSSLDRIEKLPVKSVFPSHGNKFENCKQRIKEIRHKILQRNELILEELEKGPKTLQNLVKSLFGSTGTKLIGVVIVESHLRELERTGLIERSDNLIKKI